MMQVPRDKREVSFEEKVTSDTGGEIVNKTLRVELPFASIVGVTGIKIKL